MSSTTFRSESKWIKLPDLLALTLLGGQVPFESTRPCYQVLDAVVEDFLVALQRLRCAFRFRLIGAIALLGRGQTRLQRGNQCRLACRLHSESLALGVASAKTALQFRQFVHQSIALVVRCGQFRLQRRGQIQRMADVVIDTGLRVHLQSQRQREKVLIKCRMDFGLPKWRT